MSGIIGVFNHDSAEDLVLKGIKMMEKRGVDPSSVYVRERSALGGISVKGDLILAEDRGICGYASATWEGDEIRIERDRIGIKPIFYSLSNGFAFASERKVLLRLGFRDTFELNPREVISYHTMRDEISRSYKGFFSLGDEHEKSREEIRRELKELIIEAVESRIPDGHFGLLLSGGLDSTLLACCIKQIVGAERFTCYSAGVEASKDIEFAMRAAEEHGLNLKVTEVGMDDIQRHVREVVELIEDSSAMKVGVGLPVLIAVSEAKRDGIDHIFVGNGSDELFGGYNRHKMSKDVNKDCFSDMLSYYERNSYRDEVIAANVGVELIMPFLDPKIIEYALKIPSELKIDGDVNKLILREVALDLGVNEAFAYRKKTAAQYGSGFDRAIARLARSKGFRSKNQYLREILKRPNLRLGVLYSSGKDSTYALYLMQMQNYEIRCLITLKSKNPASYMFHTPTIDLVPLQAELMGIPPVIEETAGEAEYELFDLERVLLRARDEYKIEGVVTGALYSNYQRERIELIADRIGLKVFSPLWHLDEERVIREMLNAGFRIVFTAVAAEGLDSSWLGREITHSDLDELMRLKERYGISIVGEGGELESLVIGGPNFRGEIILEDFEILEEGEGRAQLILHRVSVKDILKK
ncbi:MAG TPA: diphthine--ammonia ligase [Candidatus Syntrophoarchaeum butanivorans]|uniref:Diphthine--ammonia ligase n=1 Tax=Candidatus Syntropharchaeum butanivorans TaxID=1839936 RepID=A0A1F2P7I7_9EURY|nr:MAG: protein containing DUF71, ATP-binding region [Candidatus Syntrophoarchaeum butanivorans]HEC56688.1 diphthine--ammonia ligase [Candidatus Syntrophoarchaeum butanivorans]